MRRRRNSRVGSGSNGNGNGNSNSSSSDENIDSSTINAGNKSSGKIVSSSNEDAADRYVKNCKQFDVRVDAGVVIALKTGYQHQHHHHHHHHHHLQQQQLQ